MENSTVELTILMPCLNEAETLAVCIRKAFAGVQHAGVQEFEILIADNGSTDGSQAIAAAEGARLVHVPQRGYGAALQGGIEAACGRYIIMGDADDSYDFASIQPFVEKLRAGYQLVMGTRLRGHIVPGAMPLLHRYLGNPVLTWLGNLLFRTGFSDFHCGLRGFEREAIRQLDLKTQGMEFASEMVIRATLANVSRTEVPITLYPDGRSRPPHLRTWRDGWRHLRFMLLYSPRWVFINPGIVLCTVFGALSLLVLPGRFYVGNIALDVHTLLVSTAMFIVGVQLILMGVFARVYTSRVGLLPRKASLESWIENFSLGYGLSLGAGMALAGILMFTVALYEWSTRDFGPIPDDAVTLRIVIFGVGLLSLGLQVFFGSFVLSLLTYRY